MILRFYVLRRMSGLAIMILLLILSASAGLSQQETYTAAIKHWQTEREARLKADDGWLTLTGLFFLREGHNSFGSGPLNDIVLPKGPTQAGIFDFQGRQVTALASEGYSLIVNGVDVTRAQLYPRENQAYVTIGSITLFVHMSGERLAIRIRDTDSAIRRNFTGLRWFPVDETYRVPARFVKHNNPVTIKIQNILGDLETYTSHGSVTLSLKGETLKMLPVHVDGRLWFIFRDLTSGSETYQAARFLYADAPRDGWTVLDFNQAYNPPCAFNPYTTCPLPPRENRLSVRIEAGEMNYTDKD